MTTAPGGKGWLPYCPFFAVASDVLSRRWAVPILRVLVTGPARFGEISAAIPGLTDRLLSQRLKDLEAAGLIERRLVEDRPNRVNYELTEKGTELGAVLLDLNRWALKWVAPEDVPTDVWPAPTN